MNLWKQITRGNETRTARRRQHKTQPRLEAMESRALLNGGGASFKLFHGNLYERQGRHQSLVASDVVHLTVVNRHIIYREADGDVYEKTVSGAPHLIQAGPSTPPPQPNPSPAPSPNPPPAPQPNPAPAPNPNPWPANLPSGIYDYHYSEDGGQCSCSINST